MILSNWRQAPMIAVGLIVAIVPVLTMAQATPVADRCAGAEAYVAAANLLIVDVDALPAQFGLDPDALDDWTTEDFLTVADAYDSLADEIVLLEPPLAAETANSLLGETLHLAADTFRSVSETGIFGLLPYFDQFEEMDAEANAAIWAFETECQIAWIDDDEDGVAEIGSGVTAGIVSPSPANGAHATPGATVIAVGSRENPVPVGTTVRLDDGWEITVLSSRPDATAEIVAASSFGEVPPVGRQYFVVRIRASYAGQNSAELGGQYRFDAVGQSSVAYSYFDDDCGFELPDALPDPEVFTGGTIEGNICWAVRPEDAASLVMFDNQAAKTERLFLALQEQGGGLLGSLLPKGTPVPASISDDQPETVATPVT